MKLKIVILCLIFFCLPLTSCNTKNTSSSNISQIRKDIFYGERENLSVKVYLEEKEQPFINDGIANNRQNCLIIKVFCLSQKTSVSFKINGKAYNLNCTYNNVTNSQDAFTIVKTLPTNSLVITATIDENSYDIECKSKLKSDTISPLTALEKVNLQEKDFVSSLYENGTFNAEIYIRLLCVGDYNFYYVGYACGNNKITAFLVDGITGDIIAGKN